MYGIARGILNNNPFNIRISSIPWDGKIIPSKDRDFEQFTTALLGLRAGMRNVLSYRKLHGLETVESIISRHAPTTENNTSSYIGFICRKLSVEPTNVLCLSDPDILGGLARAITEFENGYCPYENEVIDKAARLALHLPEPANMVT